MTKQQLLEKIEVITNDFESGVSDKKETNHKIAKLIVDFAQEVLQTHLSILFDDFSA